MTNPNSSFYIKQNDTYPSVEEFLRNADGSALNITAAIAIEFHMKDGFGNIKVNQPAVLVDGPTGRVRYDWQAQDTNTPGTFFREWKVILSNGRPVHTPNWTDYPVQIAPST